MGELGRCCWSCPLSRMNQNLSSSLFSQGMYSNPDYGGGPLLEIPLNYSIPLIIIVLLFISVTDILKKIPITNQPTKKIDTLSNEFFFFFFLNSLEYNITLINTVTSPPVVWISLCRKCTYTLVFQK